MIILCILLYNTKIPMAFPLSIRKRKISFFDLESKFIPALEHIEDLIDSKLKYVLDITDHVDIVDKFKILKSRESTRNELICLTNKKEGDIKDYIRTIGAAVIKPINEGMFRIIFKNQFDCDVCSYCSSENILFFGYPTITKFSKIITKLTNDKKTDYNNVYNTDVPIDYNKLIIGPFENTTKEDLFEILNEIGEVLSIRKTTNQKYFTFTFIDADLNKSFLDVITREREQYMELPEVRYCYQDCIILRFNSFHPDLPIVCSLKQTRIVLLLNTNLEMNIENLIRDFCKEVTVFRMFEYNIFDKFDTINWKSSTNKIFIECEDIRSAEIVYYNLGGLDVLGSTLITCYYPEYNYLIGEYE